MTYTFLGVPYVQMGDRLVKASLLRVLEKGKNYKESTTYTDDKGRKWKFNEETRRWRLDREAGSAPKRKSAPKKQSQKKQKPEPENVKSSTQGRIISGVERVNQQSIDGALDALAKAGAGDRVAMFRQFLEQEQMEAVFIDPFADIDEQRQKIIAAGFKIPEGKTAEEILMGDELGAAKGYTFSDPGWTSVIIYARGDRPSFEPNMEKLKEELVRHITISFDDDIVWGTSNAAESITGADSGIMTTYFHENGHQIFNRAGRPKPPIFAATYTQYAFTDEDEWFAEHFTLWILDGDRYKRKDPEGAAFVESVVKSVLERAK